MYDGSAPTAEVLIRKIEGFHAWILLEQRVNGATQLAGSFPVNDAHSKNLPRPALREVIRDQILYLARLKCVKVQDSVNRQFDRLVAHAHSFSKQGDKVKN